VPIPSKGSTLLAANASIGRDIQAGKLPVGTRGKGQIAFNRPYGQRRQETACLLHGGMRRLGRLAGGA
jgi:hypothetical protein